MNLPQPFEAWREHVAIDLPRARAVFTTRRGGFSSGPYESLNLGRLTDDDEEAVERNRAHVSAAIGQRLASIRQVHGTSVRRIAAVEEPRGDLPEADGQATTVPGIAPMVMVADCLPVALAGGGVVAMLHAGWRGLAGGILEEGVRALRELGATGPVVAAVGPGAGPCCYEVGEEVHAAFAGYGGHVHRGRNLDLKRIAREQLERTGVDEVHDVGLCTMCSERSLFFSHRRDRGVTGRQAGLAWLA